MVAEEEAAVGLAEMEATTGLAGKAETAETAEERTDTVAYTLRLWQYTWFP